MNGSKQETETRNECISGLIQKLEFIYPEENCENLAQALINAFQSSGPRHSLPADSQSWDQQDCFVITYGDSIKAPNVSPFETLYDFLKTRLQTYFSGVHILPFFPHSSDDGFAISDFTSIRGDLGNWGDVSKIGDTFRLIADLAINHGSADHSWFQAYCRSQ